MHRSFVVIGYNLVHVYRMCMQAVVYYSIHPGPLRQPLRHVCYFHLLFKLAKHMRMLCIRQCYAQDNAVQETVLPIPQQLFRISRKLSNSSCCCNLPITVMQHVIYSPSNASSSGTKPKHSWIYNIMYRSTRGNHPTQGKQCTQTIQCNYDAICSTLCCML